MPISKNFLTPNGLATYHKVVKADLQFGGADEPAGFKLEVRSYPDEANGADSHLLWQEYPTVPVTAFEAADPYGSLERALVLQDGNPLSGGVYLPPVDAADIETLRLRKWAEIKLLRDQVESAGFDVQGVGYFDSNPESRNRISGAATAAKIAKDAGNPFSIDWTLADNSVVTLDADQMIAVAFKMLEHIDSVHSKGRGLRTQIEAAQTAEELSAINW